MANGKKVGYVAIGATCVGSVVFTVKKGDQVDKGDELGYFQVSDNARHLSYYNTLKHIVLLQFGGSTVAILFPKNSIDWDPDLEKFSKSAIETLVRQGMRIGKWK